VVHRPAFRSLITLTTHHLRLSTLPTAIKIATATSRLVYPSDSDKHNRVQCSVVADFYVNASLMRSVLDGSIYAHFAQAPVKKAVEHFWMSCYYHQIRKIVMLCAFEDPRRGVWHIPFRHKQKSTGRKSEKAYPSTKISSGLGVTTLWRLTLTTPVLLWCCRVMRARCTLNTFKYFPRDLVDGLERYGQASWRN
jgi:hypothetical protein